MNTDQTNEVVLNIVTLFAMLAIVADTNEPAPIEGGIEPADYRESNWDGRWFAANTILEQWNKDPFTMTRQQQMAFLKKLGYVWDVNTREWLWDMFDRTKNN